MQCGIDRFGRGRRALRGPARLAVACALLLCACDAAPTATYAPAYGDAPASSRRVYSFAVHPLHNPQRLSEVYGPIVAYLNAGLDGATLELQASRSYEEYEARLYGRAYDFAVPNPHEVVHALDGGYRVFGKFGDDDLFRGVIVVRRDAGITRAEHLRGKVVAFPAPTAIAATMMPLWLLHQQGLDANKDFERRYVGSQESSILAVAERTAAAGATWTVPWQAFQRNRPAVAAQLEARWITPPLVNVGVMARDDVPPDLVARVGARLASMHLDEEGRRLLAAVPISRFEPATDATYQPVKAFLQQYDRTIQ